LRVRRAARVVFIIVSAQILPMAAHFAAQAQPSSAPPAMRFDIPAEPLAKALETFATATGYHLYYDSSLAINRRSAAVEGTFPPHAAIQLLLAGTGYAVSELAGQNAYTITSPAPASAGQAPAQNLMAAFGPFLAIVQSALSRKLCADPGVQAVSEQIILSFWVSDSGIIADARILQPDDDPALNAAIGADIIGISLGRPPPAGMPQPITMVIFTTAADGGPRCAAAD
jgi:hypothetical protein